MNMYKLYNDRCACVHVYIIIVRGAGRKTIILHSGK